MQGWRIRVRGLVQGVGFRPHVWRIARDEAIAGEVVNDGEGVAIIAYGEAGDLDRFMDRLVADAPPLSRIDAVEREAIAPPPVLPDGFVIGRSVQGTVSTGVVPDAATCPACLADIEDPANRRFGYAFTNCTHCGPRLSIVRAIPYDRANTSMQAFPMCEACEAEYRDPADRRFHAQPNACPRCGPRLWLESMAPADGDNPVERAAAMLRAGHIIAIKGIGGFHLACDAMNEDAVAGLRQRKQRHAKPFAVMFRDVERLRRHCRASADEEAWLVSHAAPIVLVEGQGLAPSVSPGQDRIGAMLPYTPLHHLLLAAFSGPLVMTSGNRSEEPQAIGNDEARERLAGIADAWLMHDRDIVNRLDDSVIRVDAAGPQVIR
ncbi:MAG: Sua5/YciO/YrdC/YwlC family protein, partial [Rhizobiaceae bacterium]